MRRTSALTIALAVALGGCAGDSESRISESSAAQLVLQPGDLSNAWIRYDEGEQARGDREQGARRDPGRFGREKGWKARYRKPGSAVTSGPLVIESRVDVFEQSGGAKSDFDALRESLGGLAGASGAEGVSSPQIAEATVAATLRQGTGPGALRFYVVAWRERNVTASVLVSGFDRTLSLADVVALARKQQRRLEAAAGD